MVNRADRERFARQLQEGREYHKTEVAFIKANPIHTQEVGEQKAKEFIAHLTALTEWIEKNWDRPGGDADPSPNRGSDTPAHYEVEAFFTLEQRAVVAALHARAKHVDNASKAKSYDELLETLARCGLCPDSLPNEDGRFLDIITIENQNLANKWFRNAIVVDGDDDDD
jgi:hypothetical protein